MTLPAIATAAGDRNQQFGGRRVLCLTGREGNSPHRPAPASQPEYMSDVVGITHAGTTGRRHSLPKCLSASPPFIYLHA